mmetsp:Transcript_20594/g.48020  ORF Transcript_20594/g.48020 Transcript_20594/m.48020 type:complete len:292 (+) Transcript_20594:227-1102(+)
MPALWRKPFFAVAASICNARFASIMMLTEVRAKSKIVLTEKRAGLFSKIWSKNFMTFGCFSKISAGMTLLTPGTWCRIQSTGRTIKPMRVASSGSASTGKSLHMPPSQYTCPLYQKGSISPGTPMDIRTATRTGRSGSVSGVKRFSCPESSSQARITSRLPNLSCTALSVIAASPQYSFNAFPTISSKRLPLLRPGPVASATRHSTASAAGGPAVHRRRLCTTLPRTRVIDPSSGIASVGKGSLCIRSKISSAPQPTASMAATTEPAETPARVFNCRTSMPCRSNARSPPT